MRVRDVMHSGVIAVDPSEPIREIASLMRDQDIGSVPVIEGEHLIGIVTDRDLVCRGLADGLDIERLTARDVMTAPGVFCFDTGEVEDAVRLMESQQIRRLPVLDSQERVIGMLALGDVSARAPRDLTGEVVRSVSAHHP
jgi:CBS domain-containing protein